MNITEVNPYIRLATRSVISEGAEINRRIIFDYELIYIAEGDFVFTYNDQAYNVSADRFIFIRPNVPHSFSGLVGDLTQPHIHFDITVLPDSKNVPISFKDVAAMDSRERAQIREDVFARYKKTPFPIFKDKTRAIRLFYEIIDITDAPLLRKAKFTELLDMLIADNYEGLFEDESAVYPAEKQVKDYIDAGQGMQASLDDLALHFGYNKCYLEHIFKKSYGMGIITYRNRRRMLTAEELLKSKTVTETARSLGFSSIYVFSRAYKEFFGIPPSKKKDR